MKPSRAAGLPRARSTDPYAVADRYRRAFAADVRAHLAKNGEDIHDLARLIGVTFPRAQAIFGGAATTEGERQRLVRLIEGGA